MATRPTADALQAASLLNDAVQAASHWPAGLRMTRLGCVLLATRPTDDALQAASPQMTRSSSRLAGHQACKHALQAASRWPLGSRMARSRLRLSQKMRLRLRLAGYRPADDALARLLATRSADGAGCVFSDDALQAASTGYRRAGDAWPRPTGHQACRRRLAASAGRWAHIIYIS